MDTGTVEHVEMNRMRATEGSISRNMRQIGKYWGLYVLAAPGLAYLVIFHIVPPYITKPLNDFDRVQWLEEQTNVHIEWVTIRGEDATQQVNLMFASGEVPEVFLQTLNTSQKLEFAEEGLLLELTDLVAEYAENIKHMYEFVPASRAAAIENDGNMYTVTGVNPWPADFWASRSAWGINNAWLENLGLGMPTTTDELFDVLMAFKTEDPNGNGQADEVPIITMASTGADSWLAWYLFAPFGIEFEKEGFMVRDGKVVSSYSHPNMKEALEYISRMYAEGLINRDVFTIQQNEMMARVKQSDPVIVGATGFWSLWNLSFKNAEEAKEIARVWVPLKEYLDRKVAEFITSGYVEEGWEEYAAGEMAASAAAKGAKMSASTMFPHFQGVRYTNVSGIGLEVGVYRRDNSNVIKVGDYYYVYYNRGFSWANFAEEWRGGVWCARSRYGYEWEELGEMIATGAEGAWDAWSAYCPNILADPSGRFYLYYTGQPANQAARTPIYIGVGVSESPEGPFRKHGSEPILQPSRPEGIERANGTPGRLDNGRFHPVDGPGSEDAGAPSAGVTRVENDLFDSHRVDDASVIPRNGEYWMYYKGRAWTATVCETQIGLATAPSPTGPWRRCDQNPVIEVGHEIMVWPHGPGVAEYGHFCKPSTEGGYSRDRAGEVFYAEDGLRFSKAVTVEEELPRNPGGYFPDCYSNPDVGQGGTWGISFVDNRGSEYLVRWEMDLRAP